MTVNILLYGLTCLIVGALSLCLSYGPWTSESWSWAYAVFVRDGEHQQVGGWAEFLRLIVPLLFFVVAQRCIFTEESEKYWEGRPTLLGFYRYVFASGPKWLRIFSIGAVFLAVIYHAMLGPIILFNEYKSVFAEYISVPPLSYQEYFRPYLAYLPYTATLYILIAFPMLIVIVEGIAADKKRIRELAEPIHVVDPALASIEQLVDEAAPKKTAERKRYLAELRQLRQVLVTRFDKGELNTLCFELDIDYDDLPNEGKENRARELIVRLGHRGCISDLVRIGEKLRPDIPWSGMFETIKEASFEPYSLPPEWSTAASGKRTKLRAEAVEKSFRDVQLQISRIAGKYLYMALLVTIYFGLEIGSGLISQLACWAQELTKGAGWVLIIVILPYFVTTIYQMYTKVYRDSQDTLGALAGHALAIQDEDAADEVDKLREKFASEYTILPFIGSLVKSVFVAVVMFVVVF